MKEKIMVSACLLGVNCKYSGGNCLSEGVVSFLEGKKVIRVCPEVLGGLKIPRPACEIFEGEVVDKDGNNVTEQFISGAQKTLEIAKKHKVRRAILKSKSPSCGFGFIYDGTFQANLIEGNGFTAQLLLDHGIEVIHSEDAVFERVISEFIVLK